MSRQRVSRSRTSGANKVRSASRRRHAQEQRQRGTIAAWLGACALTLGVGAALGAPMVTYAAPSRIITAHIGHEGGGIGDVTIFGHEGGGIRDDTIFGHEGGGISHQVSSRHEGGGIPRRTL